MAWASMGETEEFLSVRAESFQQTAYQHKWLATNRVRNRSQFNPTFIVKSVKGMSMTSAVLEEACTTTEPLLVTSGDHQVACYFPEK